ncbi:MAG: hypothetical protein AAB537_00850 [Patescibacteria group bacterium]
MGYHKNPVPAYIDNNVFLDRHEKEIWWEVAQRVGHFMEEKFLEALNPDKDPSLILPDWFISVRLATPEEDHRGMDVVVRMDVGPLFIQLKSSRTNVDRFQLKHRGRTRIAIIVVKPEDSVTTIRKKFFQAATRERAWLWKRRRREQVSNAPTIIDW